MVSLDLTRTHPDGIFFFFNDTATTEIYTLSLHDALPISISAARISRTPPIRAVSASTRNISAGAAVFLTWTMTDRKSTRLNSSYGYISYAVFCLKNKNYRKSHIHDVPDY